MMRALRGLLLLAVMVLGLVACGGGGGGGSGSGGGNGDFTLSSNALTFNATTGSYPPSQTVYLSSIGSSAYYIFVGTLPGTTLPGWLSVTMASNGSSFTVSANTYGLPVGTQTTTLRVVTGDINQQLLTYKDVSVTLKITASSSSSSSTSSTSSSSSSTSSSSASSSSSSSIAPALSVTPAAITLGGTTGRDHFSAGTVSISANKTGSYSWAVQSKPAWLQLSKSTGTVGTTGDSVGLTADLSALSVGSQSGSLVLQSTIDGVLLTKTIPVTANLDKHKLIASETGISFTKTPGWSNLSRTVTVHDNFGTGGWTATSDQPWLSVTSSGNSGGALTLTASPAGLTQNVIRTANVTISSASGASSETIIVGLWNGSTTPSSVTSVAAAFTSLIADPVRPLVYAHNGGSTITIYNVYTGTVSGTISVAGATLGDMDISPDGRRLYVIDSGVIVKEINLAAASPALAGSWAIPLASTPATDIKYVRPNGEGIAVVTNVGGYSYYSGTPVVAFRAADGVVLSSPGSFYLIRGLAVSPDQNTLLTASTRYSIGYTAVDQLFNMAYIPGGLSTGCDGAAHDVAVARDGSFAVAGCVSSGTGYGFPRASLTTTSTSLGYFSGSAYPNNAEVASDGKYFLGSASGNTNVADVWVYRNDKTLQASFWLGGNLQNRQLKVSGDGFVGVALVGDNNYSTSYVKFLPVGPDSTLASSPLRSASQYGSPASVGSPISSISNVLTTTKIR